MPKLETPAGYDGRYFPMPRADEKQHQWIGRCISNHLMMQKFPGSRARANHALRMWQQHEAIKMAKAKEPIHDDAMDNSYNPHPSEPPRPKPVQNAREPASLRELDDELEVPVRNAKQDTLAAPAARRAEFGTQLPREPRSDIGRAYKPRGSAVGTAAANDEKNYYRGLQGSLKHGRQEEAEVDDMIAQAAHRKETPADTAGATIHGGGSHKPAAAKPRRLPDPSDDLERNYEADNATARRIVKRVAPHPFGHGMQAPASGPVETPRTGPQMMTDEGFVKRRNEHAGEPVRMEARPQDFEADETFFDHDDDEPRQQKPKRKKSPLEEEIDDELGFRPIQHAAPRKHKIAEYEPGAIKPARGNVNKPLKVREPKPPKAAKPAAEDHGPGVPGSQSRRVGEQVARDQWSKENNRPTLAASVTQGLASNPATAEHFATKTNEVVDTGDTGKRDSLGNPSNRPAKQHEGLKNTLRSPGDHGNAVIERGLAANNSNLSPKTFSDMVLGGHLQHARSASLHPADVQAAATKVNMPTTKVTRQRAAHMDPARHARMQWGERAANDAASKINQQMVKALGLKVTKIHGSAV